MISVFPMLSAQARRLEDYDFRESTKEAVASGRAVGTLTYFGLVVCAVLYFVMAIFVPRSSLAPVIETVNAAPPLFQKMLICRCSGILFLCEIFVAPAAVVATCGGGLHAGRAVVIGSLIMALSFGGLLFLGAARDLTPQWRKAIGKKIEIALKTPATGLLWFLLFLVSLPLLLGLLWNVHSTDNTFFYIAVVLFNIVFFAGSIAAMAMQNLQDQS